jgi:2-aminoadipate transaminase
MAKSTHQAPFALAERARRADDQPISYLMSKALANPQLISLAAGFVDYHTLPTEPLAEQAAAILGDAEAGQIALQYGTTEGLAPLRQRAFEHLAALDNLSPEALPGTADDIIVTNGSQQMLHLLTDVLIDPGDVVLAAWPSYFVYTGALDSFGAVVRAVDTDEHGLIPEKLDRLLAGLSKANQLPRVKLIYTCSYHQNPTGLTLSTERRKQLLDIVQKYSTQHRILLVEDAAYRELTYGQAETPPSIKRFDEDNAHVALLQTFSKPFAPGLKLGYGLLPSDLIEPVKRSKGGRDFGSANLCQHLMLRSIETGRFDEHVATLRETYRERRDAMLAALQHELGDFADMTWTHPTGGLYVWLTLPEAIDTGADGPLFDRALDEGVLYVPGQYCYPPDPTREVPRNSMRLSFGVPTVEQIHEGIARLARAVRQVLATCDTATV